MSRPEGIYKLPKVLRPSAQAQDEEVQAVSVSGTYNPKAISPVCQGRRKAFRQKQPKALSDSGVESFLVLVLRLIALPIFCWALKIAFCINICVSQSFVKTSGIDCGICRMPLWCSLSRLMFAVAIPMLDALQLKEVNTDKERQKLEENRHEADLCFYSLIVALLLLDHPRTPFLRKRIALSYRVVHVGCCSCTAPCPPGTSAF